MAWYSSWTRAQRLVITVPSGTVAVLPYFPVVLTSASLPTELTNNTYGRSDGGDLAFAADLGVGNSISSIGAQIPCEVVSAVFGVTPSAEIHVQVPSVAATGTLTYIWVLYGNSGQTAQPAAGSTYGSQNVWNENGTQNYAAIWHFGYSGNFSLTDSTSNANTFTNNGAVTGGTGEIGEGAVFNGSNWLSNTALATTFGGAINATLSGWMYRTGSNYNCVGFPYALNPTNYQRFDAFWYSDGNCYFCIENPTYNAIATYKRCNISTGWQWVALQYNGSLAAASRLNVWVNGTTPSTTSVGTIPPSLATIAQLTDFDVGRDQAGGSSVRYATGTVDEVRLSSVTRSNSWLSAEYANQSAPGTFIAASGSAIPTTYLASVLLMGF